MNPIILYSVLILAGLGIVLAIVLFVVANKFRVDEDPRIDEVEAVLPGANCGGCGYPGCRGFADAFVKSDNPSAMFCPVGGNKAMEAAAAIMGMSIEAKEPQVAVVRCAGSPAKRPRTAVYNSAPSCKLAASLFAGDTACPFGCLGLGDCSRVCKFGAIAIDTTTLLPVVNEELCTACGACVSACPKNVIELRKKGAKGRRVFVSCLNRDKGGVARKACGVACIGCGKCAKICPFEAITVENNVAYIDFERCKACRKCVGECPTGAIHEVNFPPRKPAATEATTVAEAQS